MYIISEIKIYFNKVSLCHSAAKIWGEENCILRVLYHLKTITHTLCNAVLTVSLGNGKRDYDVSILCLQFKWVL